MKSNRKNLGESVRQRLFNCAQESGANFNLLLTRYTLKRLLDRLSELPLYDGFVLKGAALYQGQYRKGTILSVFCIDPDNDEKELSF